MRWGFRAKDEIVVKGKVLHVRKDGGLDVEIGSKIFFNLDPGQCGLIVDPDYEGDDDDDFPDAA